jgi:hypothetical protein
MLYQIFASPNAFITCRAAPSAAALKTSARFVVRRTPCASLAGQNVATFTPDDGATGSPTPGRDVRSSLSGPIGCHPFWSRPVRCAWSGMRGLFAYLLPQPFAGQILQKCLDDPLSALYGRAATARR